MNRHQCVWFAAIPFALALAACGGDDETDTVATAAAGSTSGAGGSGTTSSANGSGGSTATTGSGGAGGAQTAVGVGGAGVGGAGVGGAGGSSQMSSSAMSSSQMSSSAMSSSATGGGMTMLNGCNKATAKPLPKSITWNFNVANNGCFKATAPVSVKFDGNLSFHPLMGGSPGNPDNASPISKHNSGDVKLTKAGAFGFYCTAHANMKGAIFLD